MLIKPQDLLAQIQTPEDLRRLPADKMRQVSDELRQYIIDVVSVYGGHFGASLGVVELSVALHYVFNTPDDQLVWDVGHQAYGHKILTGRRDQFHTNRVYGGISGFPKRKESSYDAFGVGHSSTSISAALGMALASKEKGDLHRQHVAIIGDGALTGGLAFEGLNHGGVSDTNLLVILNDNCMSIDPNVGALKDYLTDITTSYTYNKFRDEVWKVLGKFNHIGRFQKIASRVESTIKGLVLKHSNFFEALNFRYFGPIDGHDVDHLVSVLNDLKDIPGPKLLHCVTVKGKGFAPAEKDQTKWHAPGLFDKVTGEIFKKVDDKPKPPKYQDVFGHTVLELAEQNPKIMAVTPAMPSGSSLNIMMKAMPERAIDVGIAEQHAVTVSAGMATQGMTVFCNIYSTFMQRGYDQVVHDVCIQELPVIFCLDRAGFAGADGPTHHGSYDIAYMRAIPNMIVASPMNEQELRNMMYTASLDSFKNLKSAITIRYPRGEGVMPEWRTPFETIEIGKGRCIREGEEVAILSIGHIGNLALEAAQQLENEGISAAHYDMRFAKPLDEALLHQIFQKFNKIITVEDGCLPAGFGSAVVEFMADHGYSAQIKRLGMEDRVFEHGTQMELYREAGYDVDGIAKAALAMVRVMVK
ncbi:1-deoxy-D-xylulose-5-phosphate synthase [Eisenibacter elegans]|uniref:1-deoxy-D-xylulose-5-phosphate synthase n=1 Tax=Eisenibacter elegans TaxID=997 RepID=UPI0003F9E6B2|nr:1-deoxy-D-xylulose-5-phosphate synthase [Eisenibacter elegans]